MRDRTLRRTTDVSKVFPARQYEDASFFNWTEIRSLNAGQWFLEVLKSTSHQLTLICWRRFHHGCKVHFSPSVTPHHSPYSVSAKMSWMNIKFFRFEGVQEELCRYCAGQRTVLKDFFVGGEISFWIWCKKLAGSDYKCYRNEWAFPTRNIIVVEWRWRSLWPNPSTTNWVFVMEITADVLISFQ